MSDNLPLAVLCCCDDAVELCAEGSGALLRDRQNPIAPCPKTGKEEACADQPTVTIVTADSFDLIDVGLQRYHGCVERLGDTLLSGANLIDTLRRDGLYVSLTTVSAYGLELSKHVSEALQSRLGLGDDLRENLELALHESLVNGMIHGNLGISSVGRETLDLFGEYCRSVERGLADPERGHRPIEIFATWNDTYLDVSVEDDGDGFDYKSLKVGPGNRKKTSGRGLLLIGSLTESYRLSCGGRRLTMRFRR